MMKFHYAEDLACAEYLEAEPIVRRVLESKDSFPHLDPAQMDYPLTDLDYCAQMDKFDFAMPITRENGHYIMSTVRPT